MSSYNEVMIDIETLSVKREALILSIAAIQFDIKTGETIEVFYKKISLKDSLNLGFHICADTLIWWTQQNPEVFKEAMSGKTPVSEALTSLYIWIKTLPDKRLRIWGNAASFDLGILKDAYEKLKMQAPWDYREERCYRTYAQDFKHLVLEIEKDKSKAHNPVYDCEYQIKVLSTIFNAL